MDESALRVVLALILLVAPACGVGVTRELGRNRSSTDGRSDAGAVEHPADSTIDDHEDRNDDEGAMDEGGPPGDDGAAPCRSWPFGIPTPVPVLEQGPISRARLSPDERIAYLAINVMGNVNIFVSSRSSRFEVFEPPTPLSVVNGTTLDDSPSATADGLTLYFESDRHDGSYRIYRAQRAFLGAEFSPPEEVTDLGSGPSGGPYVTPDGRTLYFHALREQTMDLYRAVNHGAGFDPPEKLEVVSGDGDEYFPVVTPDELTIYYAGYSASPGSLALWTAVRASKDLPFETPVAVSGLDTLHGPGVPEPVWVSPDGCRLYFVQHDDASASWLYVAEKTPVP